MPYVVIENCIRCKYTDCVDVCPVDCFHEGPNFLVIDPEECIDCGACQPECPVEAISMVPRTQLRVTRYALRPRAVFPLGEADGGMREAPPRLRGAAARSWSRYPCRRKTRPARSRPVPGDRGSGTRSGWQTHSTSG